MSGDLSWLLTLVILLTSSFSPTSGAFIPYITLGPGIVNQFGVATLADVYSYGEVARNASYPTLSLALTLSLDINLSLDPFVEVFQFIVDLTNFRGGIIFQGQPHYVSITYTNDGASPTLAAIVYNDLLNSGKYVLLMSPIGDAMMKAVTPLLPLYNATMFSIANTDPANFNTHYPNLFMMTNTANAQWTGSLISINRRAQLYFVETGFGSANGVQTLCMFTANETLLHAAADGVREWVDSENLRRGGMDSIRVLVDIKWSEAVTNTYFDYIPFLLQCPDDTDVMVLMGGSTTGLDVASALAYSQLRPKAVIGLNPCQRKTNIPHLSCTTIPLSQSSTSVL